MGSRHPPTRAASRNGRAPLAVAHSGGGQRRPMGDDLFERNRAVYGTEEAVAHYVRSADLLPGERVILDALRDELRGQPLLDIGVGGGRTTPHLLQISEDYTAVDYLPVFVDAVRERFGLERVFQCDARDMRRFADG